MLTCQTKYHGALQYTPAEAARFPDGLPGFEDETAFLLVEQPAARPVVFLQSVATPELCFVTLPVFVVDRDYELALSAEDLLRLDLPPDEQPRIGEDVLCLTILTIQENGPTTANLMAPVVVNLRTRRAAQVICAGRAYSHRSIFLEQEQQAVC